jgi:hypothetical protein
MFLHYLRTGVNVGGRHMGTLTDHDIRGGFSRMNAAEHGVNLLS